MALLLIAQRENRRALRRERLFRDRNNPLDNLTDEEVRGRYRFSREAIFRVVEDLRHVLERPTRVISFNITRPTYGIVIHKPT